MTGGFVYIMANFTHTTLYIGVTNNLESRSKEHKNHRNSKSFTSKYKIHKLVYYETFWDIRDAIAREKQLKAGNRKRKEDLINKMNPEWKDLSGNIV
ncbi:MAG: GIY-YIG nuclease family protein [Bacteroidetes bacterium]|nr:GIY-YIG nuclease family protein [Bacteroidota bacterium]